MRVSHETIYQSLFVQGRGGVRRELARCLAVRTHIPAPARHGRPTWPDPGHGHDLRTTSGGRYRAVPGHWEGDLILGEGGRSAVGTLVERTTRLVLLLHLEDGRSALSVEAAMRTAVAALPEELRRTITWDQGAEMSTHANFTPSPGSRSTSATRMLPGSGGRTRTPAGCCAIPAEGHGSLISFGR